jgi:hypothetical protein
MSKCTKWLGDAIDGIAVRYRLGIVGAWVAFGAVLLGLFFGAPRLPSLAVLRTYWPAAAVVVTALFVLHYAYIAIRIRFWLHRGLREVNDLSMKVD